MHHSPILAGFTPKACEMVSFKQRKLLHPHANESPSLPTGYMFGPSSRLPGKTNMASADFWKSLGFPCGVPSPLTDFQISPGKNSRLHPTPAAFTATPLDGYGLCFVT